jgi:tRNA uridine 5-carboxymethylaminomethyl modification enzyme
MRLTPLGRRLGLVDDQRWARFTEKRAAIEELENLLQEHRLEGKTLSEWMRRPDVSLEQLAQRTQVLNLAQFPASAIEAVEIQAKYAGYLEREERLIKRYKQMEARTIPESFDYHAIQALRREAKEKFDRMRPRSLGQAARISGISPADIATLSIYLGQGSKGAALRT